MQQSHDLQRFALDANNYIIDIQNTNKSEDRQFFCPHCHKELIPKRGAIRQWHFAHKKDRCSYDQYLHTVAELILMDWFNKNESIILSINYVSKCDKYNHCIFYEEENCSKEMQKQYDLKKYYSTCTKEHRYKGFIADLFCENKTKPDAPIFIEIFVTHECTQKKNRVRNPDYRNPDSNRRRYCGYYQLYNIRRKCNYPPIQFQTGNIIYKQFGKPNPKVHTIFFPKKPC